MTFFLFGNSLKRVSSLEFGASLTIRSILQGLYEPISKVNLTQGKGKLSKIGEITQDLMWLSSQNNIFGLFNFN